MIRRVRRMVTPGIRYMVLASLLLSIMALFVKMAGERLPSSQSVLARAAVGVALSVLLIRQAGISPWGERRGLLLFRGAAGFAALLCYFWALTKLPIAETTILMYMSPPITTVLAALTIGERIRARDGPGLALCLAGLVLVVQPDFLFRGAGKGLDLFAAGIALLGAFLAACAYVSIRRLSASEHHYVIVLYLPLVSLLGSIPLAARTALWPTAAEWALLIGIGLTAHAAQICLTRGLERETASRAMSTSYLQVVFVSVWGYVFFQELLNGPAVAGAALIIAGTLFLVKS